MKRNETDSDLLRKIKEHVRKGTYILVKHAISRQIERRVNLPDILFVLEHGRHENTKDVFDIKRQTWRYAIRGKTRDGVDLRVIVTFEEEMVIVTIIRVN